MGAALPVLCREALLAARTGYSEQDGFGFLSLVLCRLFIYLLCSTFGRTLSALPPFLPCMSSFSFRSSICGA